ncbi:SIR2 family protein [Paenibacillus sp. KN14-4R]|uniref:SIR2 family protein n=1 Tax=Paenibacillus sp. KN14-4R TaxID=3445773 RepID=UPI003F9F8801
MYAFPELYRQASSFHHELSTIEQIKDIVTTNWDDLFERECNATPFVDVEDYIFWQTANRRVFKIHGSINNFGSIVATEEDYKKCYKRLNSGLVGSNLKMMLATKLIVFIGYSFGDEDFNKIFDSLFKEMKGLMPHSYMVTIDKTSADKLKNYNITPIITDATYFIESLKGHLVDDDILINDNRFRGVYDQLEEVYREHQKFSKSTDIGDNPDAIYSLCYQDGIIHAFERMLSNKNSGTYSSKYTITKLISSYNSIREEKLKNKIYHDVSYVDGYIDGLIFLIADDETRMDMPKYYIFGYKYGLPTFEDYLEAVKSVKQHKAAHNYAKTMASKITDKNIVYHHTPFL